MSGAPRHAGNSGAAEEAAETAAHHVHARPTRIGTPLIAHVCRALRSCGHVPRGRNPRHERGPPSLHRWRHRRRAQLTRRPETTRRVERGRESALTGADSFSFRCAVFLDRSGKTLKAKPEERAWKAPLPCPRAPVRLLSRQLYTGDRVRICVVDSCSERVVPGTVGRAEKRRHRTARAARQMILLERSNHMAPSLQ